jgi:hypothetical protein
MISRLKNISKEVTLTIGPIILIVTILQITIIKMPWIVFYKFLIGSAMVMMGLTILVQGLKISLLPIGEMIGSALSEKGSVTLLLLLGFVIGFAITIAEPDVLVLSSHIDIVSYGQIDKTILIAMIGIGVGFFILISFLRIILKIPIIYILLGGYLTILILSFFTNRNYIPVGFDAGGVTTGPITVPFIMALGLGFTTVLGGKSKGLESFGLIGLASIGPIITVLILGVIYR